MNKGIEKILETKGIFIAQKIFLESVFFYSQDMEHSMLECVKSCIKHILLSKKFLIV